MKIIILAGGSGTRLWPFSRNAFPKQFLNFGDGQSLLQKTILRFFPMVAPADILIVTNQDYYHLVKTQAGAIDPLLERQILVEPERKNTAPAICLAVKYLQDFLGCKEDECFLVSSSDHVITPQSVFIDGIKRAEQVAKQGWHVIFGIRPHKPEVGYGYVKGKPTETPSIWKVERFVEKPDYALAQEYLLSGEYLWNSGIFLFQIGSFMKEMERHCPAVASLAKGSFKELSTGFSEMPDISIDYALMEKSSNVMILPLDVSWSDVGSWDSVYDVLEKDVNQNAKVGNVLDIDTKNCLIMGGKRLISTIGLEDMLVIETDDALFIGRKGESQRVKQLVEELKKKKRQRALRAYDLPSPLGQIYRLRRGGTV